MRFKKELRTNNKYFTSAYYQDRWVQVPLFYLPKDAIGEDGYLHHFQIIPVDGEKIDTIERARRQTDLAEQKINDSIKETILPWILPIKELKKICTNNDIPENWISGFQKKISKKETTKRSTRRNNRKCKALNPQAYKKLIRYLRKISPQSALIAEILWFFNKQLQAGDDYVTLAEVLRLRIQDVDPEISISPCIRLSRTSSSGSHMVVHFLPKYIFKPLCRLIEQDSFFVFSNKNGGPLLPGDVARHFKKAGQLAGIKEMVCSLSLRPVGTPSKFEEISIQEWKILCHKIPYLIVKKGRPSKHDPRVIFNAILYIKRTGTPIRKLPPEYPPAKAIHSQYRRWKKNGVLNEVLAACR